MSGLTNEDLYENVAAAEKAVEHQNEDIHSERREYLTDESFKNRDFGGRGGARGARGARGGRGGARGGTRGGARGARGGARGGATDGSRDRANNYSSDKPREAPYKKVPLVDFNDLIVLINDEIDEARGLKLSLFNRFVALSDKSNDDVLCRFKDACRNKETCQFKH